MQTVDELLAELSTLTGLTTAEWADVLSCTPEQQGLIVQGYRDMDWVQTKTTFDHVLEILGIVGTIAGVVGGVAGAASAVAALRAL